MDLALAMDRLRPGAAYARADDYDTLSRAFAAQAAENGRRGYTMPTLEELEAAHAEVLAERDQAAAEKGQRQAVLAKLERGTATAAEVQRALAFVLARTSGGA